MKLEWQSESIDGLTGGWGCVCGSGYNDCSGHMWSPGRSPHLQLLTVVRGIADLICEV